MGLEHSKDKHSIMAPFYRGWMETVKLDTDDVKGIQSIYGRRKHVATTTSTTTTTTTTTARTTSRPRPTRTTSTRNPFRPLTTTPVPTGGKDVCEGGGKFDAATQARSDPKGDPISFEQEREKWTDWQHRLARPILPVSPFPVQILLGHPVLL